MRFLARKCAVKLRASGAGLERFCSKAKFSFACQKRTRKAPATFEAREARIKDCSPLIIPKELSKRKKASRCAKTGCGAQRPLRALSGTRVLLTAAPTAPPCIRRRRRSSLLRIFCASPIYGSADDFTSPLNFTPCENVTPAAKQQVGETRKKRLAQRLAFFRFDISSGIIKGEQPLIRASRASKVAGAFLVLFWHAKENLALPQQRFTPRHQRENPLIL